ncbi:MAG: UDP-N-acetylmuramate dehydrogenase [Vicinamibacteria bacterium]
MSATGTPADAAQALAARLRAAFGAERVAEKVPLARFTTYRVGGAADLVLEVRSAEELLEAIGVARSQGAPVTLLGGGSNVLVSDAGVRGLVIRVHGGRIERPKPGVVRADAGVTLNGLVRSCIASGLAGLEAWAGTPGTVGGAVHGNAHFDGRPISDHVLGARIVDREGAVRELRAAEMGFGYDRSRLQGSGEVLLSADFRVAPGVPAALREKARASLRYRKRTQPLARPSAGCVFQNPGPDDPPLPEGLPRSAGALIDAAGLKGEACGGAQVSLLHANFIVTAQGACAADVAALIERCRAAVRSRFRIELKEEIVRVGEF